MNHGKGMGMKSNTWGFALLLLFSIRTDFAQIVLESSPVEVVNLGEVVQRDLGISGAKALRVAQNAGAWVVLMTAPPELEVLDHSIVVTGDLTSKHALMLDGRFDEVALDQNRHIHLRFVRRRGEVEASTRFVELELTGKKVTAGKSPETYASLILTGGRVKWLTSQGVVEVGVQTARRIKIVDDPNEHVYLGLPEGRYLALGLMSEEVRIFDASNSLTSSRELDLDSAYRLVGLRVPDHSNAGTGRTRVMWATTTSSGLVCICLSDFPMSAPAYLAFFEPVTGALKSAIKLILPKVKGRRQMPHNPQGTIVPASGAFGDRLIIMDPEMGILALY